MGLIRTHVICHHCLPDELLVLPIVFIRLHFPCRPYKLLATLHFMLVGSLSPTCVNMESAILLRVLIFSLVATAVASSVIKSGIEAEVVVPNMEVLAPKRITAGTRAVLSSTDASSSTIERAKRTVVNYVNCPLGYTRKRQFCFQPNTWVFLILGLHKKASFITIFCISP